MFNLGFSELIILGVIALIFIGPNQLPEVARTIGRLLNEWKRATSDFQSTITTHITEDVSTRFQEVRQGLQDATTPDQGHSPDQPPHVHGEEAMADLMISDHEVALASTHEDHGHEGELPTGVAPIADKDKKS